MCEIVNQFLLLWRRRCWIEPDSRDYGWLFAETAKRRSLRSDDVIAVVTTHAHCIAFTRRNRVHATCQ